MEFLKHVIKDLKKTGAVAPSSKFLAHDLVDPLRHDLAAGDCPPLRLLELGPGTGPLTKEIVKHLRPVDHLDIVEIQKEFYQTVRHKYECDNVSVYFNDILNFQSDYSYDFIFSSLPYENMSREVSRTIWEKKMTLCAPQAYICYFKYVKFRKFKCDFEEQIVEEYKQNKKIVLRNIPPAKVYTLQIDKTSASVNTVSRSA